jgi:hypothetical protein
MADLVRFVQLRVYLGKAELPREGFFIKGIFLGQSRMATLTGFEPVLPP